MAFPNCVICNINKLTTKQMWSGFKETGKKLMYPEASNMKGAIPNLRPEDTKSQFAKQKDGNRVT